MRSWAAAKALPLLSAKALPLLSVCCASLRRPCTQRAAIYRTGYLSANVAQSAEADALGGTTAALLACGRRGRWRTALELLDQLEVTPGSAPVGAYRSALLACRKHKRHVEAAEILQRMGAQADTQAHNEVLHLLRLKGDYAAAETLWQGMRERGVQRDSLSYYHLLHICGELGRWDDALALIAEMRASLGADTAHAGHLLAVIRACVRDKRWDEAVEVIRSAPASVVSADAWLSNIAINACAEAGEPALAARLVSDLGAAAQSDQHAGSLIASRRACSLPCARRAWAALEASEHAKPDELCYAVMIGALFDASGTRSEGCDGEDGAEAVVREAMTLARRSQAELSAESAAVALTATVSGAINGGWAAAACQALLMLHESDPSSLSAAMQVKVLELSVEVASAVTDASEATPAGWAAVGVEARLAAERGTRPRGSEEHVHVALEGIIAACDAAVEAGEVGSQEALQALRQVASQMAKGEDAEASHADAPASGRGAAASDAERDADEARRVHARRLFSRSIALPAEHDHPLEIIYEDDDLLAVCKPTDVPVHPRHRFEANSMVNRAVAHLGGRSPYVLHRLDQGTSGLLLFAKNVLAARHVTRQFAARTTQKSYLAILLGDPAEDAFECDAPIAAHPTDSKRSVVVRPSELQRTPLAPGQRRLRPQQPAHASADGLPARPSHTRFEVLARGEGGLATACHVTPLTGRMHQIRVHAEELGHPLAGDTQYGVERQTRACDRLLLHAYSLRIAHPSSAQSVCFRAAPQTDFAAQAAALGVPLPAQALVELECEG